MNIAESWATIENWLKENAPTIRKSLRPGAKDSEFEKFHKEVMLTLPNDFVESIKIHNGQKSTAEHGLIPGPPDELGDVPSYRLLPLAEVVREWAMMKELHDAGEFVGRKPKAARGIENVWWSPGWLPIADNGGGDYFCLDLAPATGGTVGQIILFGHEGIAQRRVANSFSKWLHKLASGFDADKYAFDEDEGLVEA